LESLHRVRLVGAEYCRFSVEEGACHGTIESLADESKVDVTSVDLIAVVVVSCITEEFERVGAFLREI
jgi:hypothetical protein